MKNFNDVTSEWAKNKMEIFSLKNSELADILGLSSSQVSLWLAGKRNLSDSAKTLAYNYFENIEMSNMRSRKDVLKLSSFQYLPLHIPNMEKRYLVIWNHIEQQFCVNRGSVIEMNYLDINRYRYIMLDPEHENYSVVFAIEVHDGDLRLSRILKSDLTRDFEVKYNY